MIRVENITKTYTSKGKSIEALKGISFHSEKGEILGLLGPNGAGKTTLIRILSTIIKPTSGEAFVCGHDVVKESFSVRENLTSILQGNAVELWLNVEENLKIFGHFYNLSGHALKNRINSVMELFELEQYRKTRAGDLSGGFKRRLQVAKAFMTDTPILYLDEPTVGMDPLVKEKYLQLVKQEAEKGRTIILTTQNIDEAERLCDRVIIINEGRIITQGYLREIKNLIENMFTIKLYMETITDDTHKYFVDNPNYLNLKINPKENSVEFTIDGEINNSIDIINSASKRLKLLKFEVKEPSLEEVFVKIIKDKGGVKVERN